MNNGRKFIYIILSMAGSKDFKLFIFKISLIKEIVITLKVKLKIMTNVMYFIVGVLNIDEN